MIGYKDCPNCGSSDVSQSKRWTPDDGDPRADWYLTVKCNRCGFDCGRDQWDNTPKNITLIRAEKAEKERDEARKLIRDFVSAANSYNSFAVACEVIRMDNARRSWE